MPNYYYLFIIRYMGKYTQIRLRWKSETFLGYLRNTYAVAEKNSDLLVRLAYLKLESDHIPPIEESSEKIKINLSALPIIMNEY